MSFWHSFRRVWRQDSRGLFRLCNGSRNRRRPCPALAVPLGLECLESRVLLSGDPPMARESDGQALLAVVLGAPSQKTVTVNCALARRNGLPGFVRLT